MTKEEYAKFEEKLRVMGYRKYPSANTADFAFYKGFGESEYHEDRCNYQVCFDVYDFSKYADRDPYLKNRPYGISPMVLVSRTCDERVDLHLSHIGVDDSDIERIEKLAESFYNWVKQNIKVKKHE